MGRLFCLIHALQKGSCFALGQALGGYKRQGVLPQQCRCVPVELVLSLGTLERGFFQLISLPDISDAEGLHWVCCAA